MKDKISKNNQKNRRRFFGGTLIGMLGGALLGSRSRTVQGFDDPSAQRRGLFPEGAPAADLGYSPGILAEGQRLVFVSGQGPADYDADMETQIRQTFDRIGEVLKAGGADFKDVVMMRSYFVHISRDLPVYRKVRRDYLREPYPASTAVGVTELAAPGLIVEIEALAVIGPPIASQEKD